MRIAIIGGGPSALFVFKALLDQDGTGIEINIFEAGDRLGVGMPYSEFGANPEHVTNVSGNEVPPLITPLIDWLKTRPIEFLQRFNLDPTRLHDFKVVPRLLFGEYLNAQFELLLANAKRAGLRTQRHLQTVVSDLDADRESREITLTTADGEKLQFDVAILCTGHTWPRTHEGRHAGFFDSPYPPQKIIGRFNHPIAVRGTSLTAIDAVRTLARQHGDFVRLNSHRLAFQFRTGCEDFKIVLHSREGFLPGVRFHLEDPHLSKTSLLTESELREHRDSNDGFVSLDHLFENDFKAGFREKDPDFYEFIQKMSLEEFVDAMLEERERSEPFAFFKAEYEEALRSIRTHKSIYWKEKLAILSFAMNQPAKYFSAEDRLRLQNVLMPLISLVIAFVPQSSCEQLIALHDAGALELIVVGRKSCVEPHGAGGISYLYDLPTDESMSVRFATFINCVGQPALSFDDFPFESLKSKGSVSPAMLRFRSHARALTQIEKGNRNVEQTADGSYYLRVAGIAINDHFQVIAVGGLANEQIYAMAVPLIGGYNPDYSGLDFCEFASKRIVARIFREMERHGQRSGPYETNSRGISDKH